VENHRRLSFCKESRRGSHGPTAIDGAGRYLLRLMKAKSVTLAGGGIGIRALLDDEQSPVVSGGHLSPAQGRSQPRR
jgi:hypothetical protein